MNLNPSVIKTLLFAELKMIFRDRRVLFTSILLPILITPLLMIGSQKSIKKREQTLKSMVCNYAISGGESNQVKELLQKALARKPSETKGALFKEIAETNALEALQANKLHLVLRAAVQPPATGTNPAPALEGETLVKGALALEIVFRGDRDDSSSSASRMQERLREFRRTEREQLLKERGFEVKLADVARVKLNDLASKTEVAGLGLGRMLTLLLLVFVLSGGSMVAMDSIAGEKERGTLETLLTSAAGRVEILVAKHLSILAVALLVTVIQSLNLLLYVAFKLLPVKGSLADAVTPATVAILFVLYLPIAALASNVLLLVSSRARTYKEAQMYFLPVLLIGLLPAMAPMLPGVSLRSIVVLVPVANLAVAVREVLTGNRDWPMMLLAWLVTAGTAVWTMRLGARLLTTERLIAGVERDVTEAKGGLPLFERQVWAWFAGMWAAIMVVSGYTQKLDLRIQLVVNLVVIFFGASLLAAKRYRLNFREVFALRWPRPMVWLGVLISVPSGMVVALGVYQLANLFIPAPESFVESLGKSVFPGHIPFWQILFCITVMPAIFEELAFRGLLLHGLHRRLHPVWLCLVVGVVFGIFHGALFRLAPTAALGVLFAAVTLLTGSIYPAMVWHALSNALGAFAYRLQIPETELDATAYLAGAGLMCVAAWIFWRNRTPYPGMKSGTSQPGGAKEWRQGNRKN